MGVAKRLWGSFKLVTPAPKPVREMTQLPRETRKDGRHKQIKAIQTLKIQAWAKYKHNRPNRAVWTGPAEIRKSEFVAFCLNVTMFSVWSGGGHFSEQRVHSIRSNDITPVGLEVEPSWDWEFLWSTDPKGTVAKCSVLTPFGKDGA